MTGRVWAPGAFLNEAAQLLARAAAIVAASPADERKWAATVVWEAARRIAAGDRRVLLVDLCVNEPTFEPTVPPPAGEGAVDAFFYGASLQRVSTEQDQPGFFFLSAGTRHAEPVELWSHSRWRRLARGFGAEGAALILFVPEAALPHLTLRPDRVLLLGAADAALERGAAELAGEAGIERVRRAVEPRPSQPVARPSTPLVAPMRRRRQPANPMLVGLALVVVGTGAAAAALSLLTRSEMEPTPSATAQGGQPDGRTGGQTDQPGGRSGEPITDGSVRPSADRPARSSPAADSLYYSVQIAAFRTNESAMVEARAITAAGWPATVSPIRLGRQGTWYRLLVGAAPSAAAARDVLRALWADGRVERETGTIVRTPHAIEIGEFAERTEARRRAAALRDGGSPAYIVEAPDGTHHVLVGAFEAPEQARLQDSLLRARDVRGTVVLRRGIAR
jgi:cell division septation protein DedD